MESQSVAREQWEGTPEYTALVTEFHHIGESVRDRGGSEEEAKKAQSMFWKGASFELDKLTDVECSARVGKIEADRSERAGREWREEAFQGTQSLPPAIRNIPEFSKWFTAAVETFNAELAMGHYPEVKDADAMHEKFKTIFGQRSVREPAVKTVFADIKAAKDKTAAEASVGAEQAKRDKAAVAATAVQDFKEGVANSRVEAPPNPLGTLGPGTSGATTTGEPPPDAEPDTSKMLQHELKKFMRQGSREDGQRRLGTPI